MDVGDRIFFAIFVLLYEAECLLNISYLATLDFENEVNFEELSWSK